MNFEKVETYIEGLFAIRPRLFPDERGFFFETYKYSHFDSLGIKEKIIQVNQSKSLENVIRGLHLQVGRYAQAKLVRCISGIIYDVAVDLRHNSRTFGKHFGIELSSENNMMLYIPVGFAHGFSVLSKDAEVIYDVFGGEYNKESERGIIYNDIDLSIDWKVKNPIVSNKDLILPKLKDFKDR